MKKSENVYVILDWFDYGTNDLSHSADAFNEYTGRAEVIQNWGDKKTDGGADNGKRELKVLKAGDYVDRIGGENGVYVGLMKNGKIAPISMRALGKYYSTDDPTKLKNYYI